MVLSSLRRTPPPGASPPPGLTWPGFLRGLPGAGGRPPRAPTVLTALLGNSTAPLAEVLLLQSARELSPTPHARIKEQTENGAEVEPGVASSSALDVPSAATPADYVPGPPRTSSKRAQSQLPGTLVPSLPPFTPIRYWCKEKEGGKVHPETWNCRWMRKIHHRKFWLKITRLLLLRARGWRRDEKGVVPS